MTLIAQVLGASSIDASTLAERFVQEAPGAWRKMRAAEINGRFRLQEAFTWTGTKHFQNREIDFEDQVGAARYLRVVIDRDEAGQEARFENAVCYTPDYSFILRRKGKEAWQMKELSYEAGLARGEFAASSIGRSILCGIGISYGEAIVESTGFKVISAKEGSEGRVDIEFEVPPTKTPTTLRVTRGRLTVVPKDYWAIVHCDAEVLAGTDNVSGSIEVKAEYQVAGDGLPRPTSAVIIHGTIPDDGQPLVRTQHYTYSENSPGFSVKDCRLTAFGISEPEHARGKSRLWFMLLNLVVGIMLVGGSFYGRRRGSTRNASSDVPTPQ